MRNPFCPPTAPEYGKGPSVLYLQELGPESCRDGDIRRRGRLSPTRHSCCEAAWFSTGHSAPTNPVPPSLATGIKRGWNHSEPVDILAIASQLALEHDRPDLTRKGDTAEAHHGNFYANVKYPNAIQEAIDSTLELVMSLDGILKAPYHPFRVEEDSASARLLQGNCILVSGGQRYRIARKCWVAAEAGYCCILLGGYFILAPAPLVLVPPQGLTLEKRCAALATAPIGGLSAGFPVWPPPQAIPVFSIRASLNSPSKMQQYPPRLFGWLVG